MNNLKAHSKALNKKQLKNIFYAIKSNIKENMSMLYLTAFLIKIKPIADRYNWTIDWGMGSVSFETKDGRDLYPEDSKALKKMVNELENMFDVDSIPIGRCGILWDIMISLGNYNRYNKTTGFQLKQ